MSSLCSKLLPDKEDRLWFTGMIVIAANAGGAWSPLGDVTTTMLWIGGQVTALNIMKELILPSIGVCLFPALIIAFKLRGQKIDQLKLQSRTEKEKTEGKIVLFSGIGFLIFVPVFKTLTHLPPFMGKSAGPWVNVGNHYHNTQRERSRIAQKYTVTKSTSESRYTKHPFFPRNSPAISALQSNLVY